ncbi:ankyrin-1-like [Leptopilina heterotoma]|uniref:ankyrin-1-like n=1 Tax=Leptopilina heterotoma TaxID=63436 RepID=UPI001CA940E3|nr:ankyrin-1-like [Leptopilina heterotoma]
MEKNIFKTPLFNAAKKGILEEVKFICETNIEEEERVSEYYPSLYIASYQGNEEIVEYLLYMGADPNYSFKNYLPPLHAAAQKGRLSIVKLLLDYGAEINPKPEEGFFSSPLLTASRGGHEFMVKFLLDHGANIEAKLNPICVRVSSVIERLFAYGDYSESEINSKSEKIGYTSLHLSADNGERRVVRILIKYGANVNSKSNLNISPLFVAIIKNFESIIQLLKKGGANLNDTVNGVSLCQYLILRDRKKNDSNKQKSCQDPNSEEEKSEEEEEEYSSDEK